MRIIQNNLFPNLKALVGPMEGLAIAPQGLRSISMPEKSLGFRYVCECA